jgi:hypothetical protein
MLDNRTCGVMLSHSPGVICSGHTDHIDQKSDLSNFAPLSGTRGATPSFRLKDIRPKKCLGQRRAG